MALIPSRTKFRKSHRGSRAGNATRGTTVAFGEYGEGYVRIGLVENENRIRQAARNVRRFLSNADEILGRAHNTGVGQ